MTAGTSLYLVMLRRSLRTSWMAACTAGSAKVLLVSGLASSLRSAASTSGRSAAWRDKCAAGAAMRTYTESSGSQRRVDDTTQVTAAGVNGSPVTWLTHAVEGKQPLHSQGRKHVLVCCGGLL
eukprot:GHRQ01028302.1.p1 GENE.GHRQ01028302.1~~GHRQ01028302.1.p1  ORF type:complete len:123 (-),score=32.62 GHRQ01028302.1:86-454(-)